MRAILDFFLPQEAFAARSVGDSEEVTGGRQGDPRARVVWEEGGPRGWRTQAIYEGETRAHVAQNLSHVVCTRDSAGSAGPPLSSSFPTRVNILRLFKFPN